MKTPYVNLNNAPFSEESTLLMTETNRSILTESNPVETSVFILENGGWKISDADYVKLQNGETVYLYSPRGDRRIKLVKL